MSMYDPKGLVRITPPVVLQPRAVVQVVLETVTWRERLRRIWGWLTWRLRPGFLKYCGKPVRLRWWLCMKAIDRIEPTVQPMLDEARPLLFQNFEEGRTNAKFLHGKRLCEVARGLEARMVAIARKAGAQHPDGTSTVDLMAIARRIR